MLSDFPASGSSDVKRCREENLSLEVDPSKTRIVGLCTGSFAAAAVASSPSPATIIPFAVEIVGIAFRTGLYIGTLAQRLYPRGDLKESWAFLVLETEEIDASHALQEFYQEEVCSHLRTWDDRALKMV